MTNFREEADKTRTLGNEAKKVVLGNVVLLSLHCTKLCMRTLVSCEMAGEHGKVASCRGTKPVNADQFM